MSSTTDNVVATGTRGTIEYALDDDGNSELKTWFKNQNSKVQSQFDQLFQRLVNEGVPFPNTDQLKKMKLDGDVWEFRRGAIRIFCVKVGRRWLLTHRYQKGHSKKHQTNSAKLAVTISETHLERERNKLRRKKNDPQR